MLLSAYRVDLVLQRCCRSVKISGCIPYLSLTSQPRGHHLRLVTPSRLPTVIASLRCAQHQWCLPNWLQQLLSALLSSESSQSVPRAEAPASLIPVRKLSEMMTL